VRDGVVSDNRFLKAVRFLIDDTDDASQYRGLLKAINIEDADRLSRANADSQRKRHRRFSDNSHWNQSGRNPGDKRSGPRAIPQHSSQVSRFFEPASLRS
jgi:hypothetical protein